MYLVPYFPTPIRTRPYNFIRALARRGNQVSLFTVWEKKEDLEYLSLYQDEGVETHAIHLSRSQIVINLTQSILKGIPLQASYSWVPRLRSEINAKISMSSFDVIHIEHLRGAQYGLAIQASEGNAANQPGIPMVVDLVDCISNLFQLASSDSKSSLVKAMASFELPRTRKYEARLLDKFRSIVISSANDRQALFQNYALVRDKLLPADLQITILPNGVDMDYFHPNGSEAQQNHVVFSGKLSYHANVTAALELVNEVMPRIWDKKPQVIVTLVGKDPPRKIRELTTKDSRIQVTGTVNDIRPYLQQATLAIIPIKYGAGIQNKVLEAMACGAPVVASKQAITAMENIQPGEDILVGNNIEEIAHLSLALLNDRALQNKYRKNGYRYVHKWHNWGIAAQQLEKIYSAEINRSSIN